MNKILLAGSIFCFGLAGLCWYTINYVVVKSSVAHTLGVGMWLEVVLGLACFALSFQTFRKIGE